MYSKLFKRLNPYIGSELRDKVEELKREGKDIVALNVGEPDFLIPTNVIEAARKAMDEGFTKYTPIKGIYELRKAIVDKLLRINNIKYSLEEVTVGPGAKILLATAMMVLCDENDEVILPRPAWGSYPEIIHLSGAKPVFVETTFEKDFQISIQDIEKSISDKTKAIIITNPNNPTGAVLSDEFLLKIGKLAEKYNLFIISDEVYESFTYNSKVHSIASLDENIKKRTVVINGLSKTYGMTGWRLGYCAASKEIIDAINVVLSYTTSSTNSISQKAAIEALNNCDEFVKEKIKEFNVRRKYFIEGIKSIEGLDVSKGEGAFYLMIDIRNILNKKYKNSLIDSSDKFAKILISEKNVIVTPGEVFKAPGFLRVSYAVSMENIKKAIVRIRELVKETEL